MITKNIFSDIPKNLDKEYFEEILKEKNFRVERIISNKQFTPKGKWYNQDKNEFVMLLKGGAELLFTGEKRLVMKEGDYIVIPAHLKHKVTKTEENTFWLTIFY